MNKLEKHKEGLVSFYMKGNADDAFETGYKDGFNAAIALDLPVKFAQWVNSKQQSWKEWRRKHYHLKDGEELRRQAYDFWIENIYDPEI